MSEMLPKPSTLEQRVARLEQNMHWPKIGLAAFVVAIVALSIPPLAAIAGMLLFAVLVGGAVVVFITSIMLLLDRLFPGANATRQPRSGDTGSSSD